MYTAYAQSLKVANSLQNFFRATTIRPVPTPLSPEQNARVQQVANDLIAHHNGNKSAAARAVGKDQSWLGRVADGKIGASLETASLLCAAIGRDVSEVLGLSPIVTTWSELPGYDEALAQAKAALNNMHDERIWSQVGRLSMPPHPSRVEPWMLIQLAQFVAALNSRPTPLLPAPTGSTKRLRAAKRS